MHHPMISFVMMRALMFAVVVVHCTAVLAQSTYSETIGYRPRLRDTTRISQSFNRLEAVLAGIEPKVNVEIYRGIPRPKSPQASAAVDEQAKLIRRFYQAFYQKPVSIDGDLQRSLVEVLSNIETYSQFKGFKLCGGFHPDFAVVVKSEEVTVEFQICLTCHEMKIFRNRVEIYCDLKTTQYKEISALLKNLDGKLETKGK